MIPTEAQAKALWDTYHLPEKKRIHVTLVANVALFLAKKIQEVDSSIHINTALLYASALLHDIDKAIPKLPGEQHPDTGVRILRQEGLDEVADIVKTHSLHAILNVAISPKTWEERLLYLADKMVKLEIITVDKRFELWNDEHLPPKSQALLDQSYPLVKDLEQEIFTKIAVQAEDIAKLA
jgi:putative nucleotidyltransferase with HDIG domain